MPDTLSIQPQNLLKGRIPSLDGLRAFSFLLVFVSHLGFLGARPGGFAVGVFFSISGYLITNLLIREFYRTGTISLRNFYIRRTARIFPGFYVALALCLVLVKTKIIILPLYTRATVLEALYLENYADWWGRVHGILEYCVPMTSSFWSLCVEEHFYLLFPILFVALLRRQLGFTAITKLLGGLCLVFLAWRFVAVRILPFGEVWCYSSSDARMDSILWGCILACAEQVEPWRAALTLPRLERVLVPLGLLFTILTFVFHDAGRMTTRFTIQAVGLLPLIFYVTHFADRPLGRLLNLRLLVHLGTLSYALYLLHGPVMTLIESYAYTNKPVIWLLCAVCTYVAGLLMHWTIERPFEGLRARLRTSTPAVAANS